MEDYVKYITIEFTIIIVVIELFEISKGSTGRENEIL
jgi:hypothetical protein